MGAETLRVSVIIPTYNRAAYLREALASVFRQSLAPWEVIVVDDGSTDETYQVIQESPGAIRFYRQAHQGVATARNLGLEKATGDLVAWLDSDDLWEPTFLATVVSLLAQDRALDGAYTGITLIDSDGAPLGTSTRLEPPEELHNALVRDCFLAAPSVVARKKCYDQAGGFDPQFRISEDYDMWLRLARQFRIVGVPQPLVRIRVHTTNTMSDVDSLCKARLALARKHFGRLGDISTLSDTVKAAYGYAFRSIALKYIETGQPTNGWAYLEQAVALHPPILERLDTFYELACGDQPRGYRGQADLLDIAANGADMLRRLDALFATAKQPVRALRGAAYGNAYLALGMLSDQAGDWAAARRYMLQAACHNPRLLSRSFVRRLLKVGLGKWVVSLVRTLRGLITSCHRIHSEFGSGDTIA